jgi:hypothetical protein
MSKGWAIALKGCAVALLVSQVVAAAPPERTLRSAALAKQLGAALHERGLDAVATTAPNESDRFIAALFYPNAQLLVISARYASPPLLEARLSQKQYRDVYLDLGGASIPNSSLLVHDIGADGLCDSRDKSADILYEGNVTSMFDADWKSHNRSEHEYLQRLFDADERYSRMLELLLAEVKRA